MEFPSGAVGVSVTVNVEVLYDTVAATSAFDGSFSRTVAVVTDEARSASLKITLTAAAGLTPTAPPAGVTPTTVGGVVSASVVNDQLASEASALPARSFTPAEPPVTTAV